MATGLQVVVAVAAGPRQVHEVSLQLAPGACVADALQACQALPLFAGLELARMPTGIWGRTAGPAQALRDGDRVELYRPLLVDPKVARRERFARQGARATGLFAKKRPGAKAGY
ncbi:RnfH family protein [Pseudorhodoferax sp. Leaf267]|uniref:RnfH family protein n=1 Tax=Pseudorhodoferax sp. Leaf267 TaxID=1736316 RepID=UPI0006FEAC13|nr:RnfH family protein [Pseudorhodoferax sp. Leaf267]KQP14729.1 protein rnfH [Pseudorhodoferax sp. Leaf267]